MTMYSLNPKFPLFAMSLFAAAVIVSAEERWNLDADDGIEWPVEAETALPHADHFAMSGRTVDLILEWQVKAERGFAATRVVRWPMLRTLPDNTHASLQRKLDDAEVPPPLIDGEPLPAGVVETVAIDGTFMVTTRHGAGLSLQRTVFPSLHSPAVIDVYTLTHTGDTTVRVEIPAWKVSETTPAEKGLFGAYVIDQRVVGEGVYHLAPGSAVHYAVVRAARLETEAPYYPDPAAELAARRSLIERLGGDLVLETPDPVLDRLFRFSKLRVGESIFATRGGLMHGPGGYNKYLAAIWANDEAEYANPFFPFLGDAAGNESAMTSFRMFADYINPEFKPIPSSIIAEGRGFWAGEGDRGDMAMIAYGAARFALASGNPEWAKELWPLITWCLEYCDRQRLPEGVIASDSDELENRFPAGEANLCTSSLYYDALLSAFHLSGALGRDLHLGGRYIDQSDVLREAIAGYFEAEVEGYATYRYYAGNTELRSWICVPLTVGIHDRAEGTIDALFSDKLWTPDGLLTKSGTTTVWDRSTLYALRGVFEAGATERGLPRLQELSRQRLLGDHVPYLMEANSEYKRSQISAESALYCRIFTEGLFGIRPVGFDEFICTPVLPESWDRMALKRIHAFGRIWNLELIRIDTDLKLKITDTAGKVLYSNTLPPAAEHRITLGAE